MKYMGSKNRLARYLLPIILKDRKIGQFYVEPFVGGCNLIDKVSGNRIGNDNNYYVIQLFKALQHGFIPPSKLTEQEYNHIKDNPNNYAPELVGFVGIGCSYSGKWFGGYARGNNSNGQPRNYCLESKKNILKQINNLIGVEFYYGDYKHLIIPNDSIIYCDPPYKNTTKYNNLIDYEEFYNWCRQKKQEGHIIYISEFAMPKDFICLWNKDRVISLTNDTGSKIGCEKLYTL